MEYSEVKQLIEKYFAAKTSLQEEAALKHYFQNEDVPGDLKIYQPLFQQAGGENLLLNEDFDNKILGWIEAQEKVKIKPVRNIYNVLKVAAAVLLIVTSGILMYNYSLKKNNNEPTMMNTTMVIEDTYDDPELARQELEKALALLSSKMNKGQEMAAEKASKLQVISKAIETSN